MTGALIMSAVATAVGGITSYLQNKRMANAAKAQASAQAASYEQQAQIAQGRAEIEQIKGEQEAAKRSRLLSADIGSTYANFAGNGLLADSGSGVDTLSSVLKTQAAEGAADINTIKSNAVMGVWTNLQDKANAKANATNSLLLGKNQADNYRFAANLGMWQAITGLPLTSNNGFGQMTSIVGSSRFGGKAQKNSI